MTALSAFLKLRKAHPLYGNMIVVGLMVLLAAAGVAGYGVALDTLIPIGIAILLFSAVVLLFPESGGWLRRLLSGFFCLMLVVWATALLAQILTGGRVPHLASVSCLAAPFSDGCEGLQKGQLVSVGSVATSIPDPESAEIPSDATTVEIVYVQFAGLIDRSSVADFSTKLVENGWPVSSPGEGGERTSSAAGLNEIRYFHEEDLIAAAALAVKASEISPAGTPLELRDLSDTKYSRPDTKGLLEIWISN